MGRGSGGGGFPNTQGGYLKGLVQGRQSKPTSGKLIRSDKRAVNSQEFKDFIRSQGKSFRKSEWKYVMETWELPDGRRIERHYWTNGADSYYHK